jgi:hypothetical protein
MAIDPTLSLAFSIHSNPGIYSVLLGSGLSRAAGVPTGWEIVLDLIRKIARINGENCEPDPEVWYKNKYREEPNYSKIIDGLAKSPAERSQLLRSYFEPNEKEREEGLKMPTVAHKAISELVAKGYIKVIITTNFDRLLENALEEKGIIPTIISTTDSVKGALPLTHTKCTLLKVHGDYIDTRIKNTPTELESYDKPLNRLLDQIFDEFGLIICGWSAEWDRALCSALERCNSHRFTTYWTLKEEPMDVAKKLIKLRRAEIIKINDADSFFSSLEQKVSALHDLERPHPLSSKLAVVMLKKYLSKDNYRIQLNDLVMEEANKVYKEFLGESFSPSEAFNEDRYKVRIQKYESIIEILLHLFINGCYWGEKNQEDLWARCLERVVVSPRIKDTFYEPWISLSRYPALLLLYAGGISSIVAGRYNNLAALLTKPKFYYENKYFPLILFLAPEEIINKTLAERIFNDIRAYTPVSNHLQQLLREPLKEFIPEDKQYEKYFDRFEYLFALVKADFHEKNDNEIWGPVGCFGWRKRTTIIEEIELESKKEGDSWPPLRAGLFDGSYERFMHIKNHFDKIIRKLFWR